MYTVELYLRVRLACHVDGLSQREAASRFGLARETVKKMLRHSEPPGYRRRRPPKRPKLDPFTDVIDRILEDDRTVHRKQRHTAKRVFERLRDEHGFAGGQTIVKDYVRERRRLAALDVRAAGQLQDQRLVERGDDLEVEAVEALDHGEAPHRVCRRLQLLRGWSYDKTNIGKLFT